MIPVAERVREIRRRISEAALKSGRKSDEISVMAVTKTRYPEEIREVWREGIVLFGENRVQEEESKIGEWSPDFACEWRLIGHLQRNKARKALGLFSGIDSLDRIGLAEDLERILSEKGQVMPVLVEVNTSGEAAKHGVAPEELEGLVERVLLDCPSLNVRGLMTVGPLHGGEKEISASFCLLRELAEKVSGNLGIRMQELSMGMSGDFELAIEQGSTCVRLGQALFGPREYREV